MIEIKFFTTAGCHLCEEALMLCQPLVQQGNISMEIVDIADSEQLVEQYGLRIPVLQRVDTGCALDWPFDFTILNHFLH